MESGFTPDPLRAIRDRSAEAVRGADLASERGKAVARDALELERETQEVEAERETAREQLRARRARARASIAYEWAALGVLVLLALATVGVIAWILLWSGFSREAKAGTLPLVLSCFGTLAWLTLRRAEARRRDARMDDEGDADESPGEENEDVMPLRAILRRLRDRRR